MKLSKPNLTVNAWLVENRSRVQLLIFDFQRFLSHHRRTVEKDKLGRVVFMLLVGAGFCLWRATFLTNSNRRWPGILSDLEKLMEFIVTDNAIGYNQEKATQKWMVGYYLDSAGFRLAAAIDTHLPNRHELEAALNHHDFRAFRELRANGINEVPPRKVWEITYKALVRAYHLVKYDHDKTSLV